MAGNEANWYQIAGSQVSGRPAEPVEALPSRIKSCAQCRATPRHGHAGRTSACEVTETATAAAAKAAEAAEAAADKQRKACLAGVEVDLVVEVQNGNRRHRDRGVGDLHNKSTTVN